MGTKALSQVYLVIYFDLTAFYRHPSNKIPKYIKNYDSPAPKPLRLPMHPLWKYPFDPLDPPNSKPRSMQIQPHWQSLCCFPVLL